MSSSRMMFAFRVTTLCSLLAVLSACGGGGGGSSPSPSPSTGGLSGSGSGTSGGNSSGGSQASASYEVQTVHLDNGLNVDQTSTPYLKMFAAFGGIYGSNYHDKGNNLFRLGSDGSVTEIAFYPQDPTVTFSDLYPGSSYVLPQSEGVVWYRKNGASNANGTLTYTWSTLDSNGSPSSPVLSFLTDESYSTHRVIHSASGDLFDISGVVNGGSHNGTPRHGYFSVNIFSSTGVAKTLNIFTSSPFYEANVSHQYAGVDGKIYIIARTRSEAEVNAIAITHRQLIRMDANGNTEDITEITNTVSPCFGADTSVINRDGNHVVICDRSLNIFDYQTGALLSSTIINDFTPQFNSPDQSIQPTWGQDGNLWFQNGNQFYAINPATAEIVYRGPLNLGNHLAASFIASNDGKLWLPVYVDGSGIPSNLLFSVTGYAIPNPVNDQFRDALPLTGLTGTVFGLPARATSEAGEPTHLNQAALKSLWWTWTAPADGQLTLTTLGSVPRSGVAVYTGNTLTTLQKVSDISQGKLGYATIPVVGGTTYHIAVDSFYNNATFSLLTYRFSQ